MKKLPNTIKRELPENKENVFFVGAGPGNVDLLTIAGYKAIKMADVIFFDSLLDEKEFKKINQKANWLNVGKRCGKISIDQKLISKSLVNYSNRNFKIVRLKGGDPSIFGRLAEETLELKKHNIPFKIIPGVSSAQSSAADLKISLTEREVSRSLCFVTPSVSKNSAESNKWISSVLNSDTSIIYMGGRCMSYISKKLISSGINKSIPVAIVESSSLSSIKTITTLEYLEKESINKLNGPVCLIIGKVVDQSRFNNRNKSFCAEKIKMPCIA